jgi:D-glycero-D-manno-heptose 1,7-bisphosphate phosphatase
MTAAVLFDRDGTIVLDVPYNGDPRRVTLAPTAGEAIELLRRRGVPFAVVSNQSGVARGHVTREQVDAVNARVAQLLSAPQLAFFVCPHGEDDGCGCRKPAPGLLKSAADHLGVPVESCGMVGDIGADVEAGLAAGARPVLVPTAMTRAEEVAAAPEVASTVYDAVRLLLDGPVA